MTYHHGITAQEKSQGIMPMRNANMSIICLIAISEDADNAMYPMDTPVLLPGIKQSNLDKAGTKGTLGKYLRHIRDIHNPTIVVLRLSNPEAVDTLDILRSCQSRLGVTPKIMGAPELDTPAMVQKMVTIAKDRRMMVYANCRNEKGELITKIEELVKYRNKYGHRELMLIDNAWAQPNSAQSVKSNGASYITLAP